MSALIALDVALLLPPGARQRAIELSRSIAAARRSPSAESQARLQLDEEHLPHITLTQQFVRADEIESVFERVDETLRGQAPLAVRVTGGGKGSSAVWMSVERTVEIARLHERLMEALRGLERPGGTAAAFFEGDARVGDVAWVATYRLKSSLGSYNPHVTLGYASEPPDIAPFAFDAVTVAACHLGRYCSCRKALRAWDLIAGDRSA
jgi:2'-5' RNA ligase